MQFHRWTPIKATSWLAGGLCCVALGACRPIAEEPSARAPEEGVPAVTRPAVERDLEQILASGVIRMLTRYNSSNYFIHKGGPAGFEYELFSRFARSQGLAVEVVTPESADDLISMLNSGRGDVIAAGMTNDEELTRFISFTRPYNFVRKVVVLPVTDPRPNTLEALNGLALYLPAHSNFRRELLKIKNRYRLQFFVANGRPLAEAEELIGQVDRLEIPATVVDDNLAHAALTYLDGVRIGPQLGSARPVAWGVRVNSPGLKAALNAYLKGHFWVTPEGQRRSRTYGILYERYYRDARQIRGFQDPGHRLDKSGRISPYDEIFQAEARMAGLDWRMVAAIAFRESRLDTAAISNAGAMGLMQVMPRFAGHELDQLFDPRTNIAAGVRLLKEIFNSYAYLDSLERWRFTLATYHAGFGHMADARRLAIDMGRDPNRWEGSVAEALPRLMQQRFFSHTRHGFYRGEETVAYVKDILIRYREYLQSMPARPPSGTLAADGLEPPPRPQ